MHKFSIKAHLIAQSLLGLSFLNKKTAKPVLCPTLTMTLKRKYQKKESIYFN